MKRLIQLTILAILSVYTGVFAQVSSSKWQTQPIILDGNGSDWGTLPRFFNTESNVKYEFRNDAQNIYIILKAADRAIQMQLLRAGFNVKLKVKTSPPIKVGITFMASKIAIAPIGQNNQDKLVDKSFTNPELVNKDTAFVDGFQYAKGKIFSENKDEKSICFARSQSNRELATYEIGIPLREIYGNDYKLDNISITPIQLQVSINDLSQNEMKKMKGRMGGGHGGGMHGGGRGMGGEMGSRDMENGGIGGSEVGEMPGTAMEDEMQVRGGLSMERKSFSIDFKLSSGK